MRTFADVMDAAETGSVEYGLLPIESTLMGGVDSAYDLLAMHERLLITAETVVAIRLCVLGLPGARLADVTQLHSHPLMLAQCAHFLERYKHITPVPAWDTAGAAPGPGGGESLDTPMEPRFRRTDELFEDPSSRRTMRVWLDPATGERRYRAEG